MGRIFEGKQGFATLRDLYRWAGRQATSYEELALHGYMLLAERARHDDDKQVVKEVLEDIMKVRIDELTMYNIPRSNLANVTWTKSMRRLFFLLSEALDRNEPVLLVGETCCGKTTVCQLYAKLTGKSLAAVNCHQNTEAADIIGRYRPVRDSSSKKVDVIRRLKRRLNLSEEVEAIGHKSVISMIDARLKAGNNSDSDQLHVDRR